MRKTLYFLLPPAREKLKSESYTRGFRNVMASALWKLREKRIRAAIQEVKAHVDAKLPTLVEAAAKSETSAVVVSFDDTVATPLISQEALRRFVQECQGYQEGRYTLENGDHALRLHWDQPILPKVAPPNPVVTNWEGLSYKVTNAREEFLEKRKSAILGALVDLLDEALNGVDLDEIFTEGNMALSLGNLEDLDRRLDFTLTGDVFEKYCESHNSGDWIAGLKVEYSKDDGIRVFWEDLED